MSEPRKRPDSPPAHFHYTSHQAVEQSDAGGCEISLRQTPGEPAQLEDPGAVPEIVQIMHTTGRLGKMGTPGKASVKFA